MPSRVAVLGATEPTGIHLVRELASRGRSVRAVSRGRDRLEEFFGGDQGGEIATVDALDPEAVGRVVEGSDLVIDCIGLPPERMADHPKTGQVLSTAARAAGARCLQISSYWSFFPHEDDVVSDHPRQGGHEWFRLRREAEDVMLAAGAAVVHLPDFFRPEVHPTTVQSALEEAVSGKPAVLAGSVRHAPGGCLRPECNADRGGPR